MALPGGGAGMSAAAMEFDAHGAAVEFDFDDAARVLGESSDLLRALHMQGAALGYPATDMQQRLFLTVSSYLDTVALSLLAARLVPA